MINIKPRNAHLPGFQDDIAGHLDTAVFFKMMGLFVFAMVSANKPLSSGHSMDSTLPATSYPTRP